MSWNMMYGAGRGDVIRQVLHDQAAPTVAYRFTQPDRFWTVQSVTSGPALFCYELRRKAGYGWGYRGTVESDPPTFHDCPMRLLDLARGRELRHHDLEAAEGGQVLAFAEIGAADGEVPGGVSFGRRFGGVEGGDLGTVLDLDGLERVGGKNEIQGNQHGQHDHASD